MIDEIDGIAARVLVGVEATCQARWIRGEPLATLRVVLACSEAHETRGRVEHPARIADG